MSIALDGMLSTAGYNQIVMNGMALATIPVALTSDGRLATPLVGATLVGVAAYVVTRPSIVPRPSGEDTPAVTPAR